jgi:hypothetical protein
MAKAKATEEVVEIADNGLVEVEYVLGAFNATINGGGFRVEFVDGKASVMASIAEALKEAKLIK